MYIGEERDAVFDTDGTLVAYKAHRSGYTGEHWFVNYGLDDRLERAAKNAIFSLSGVPDAAALMYRIQLILDESA